MYTTPKKGNCPDTSKQQIVEVAEQTPLHELSHKVTPALNHVSLGLLILTQDFSIRSFWNSKSLLNSQYTHHNINYA